MEHTLLTPNEAYKRLALARVYRILLDCAERAEKRTAGPAEPWAKGTGPAAETPAETAERITILP